MTADTPEASTPQDEVLRGGQEPLRGRVLAGGLWVGLARALTVVLQVMSTVVLARLLAPDDFGLFALTMVFVNFSTVLVHAGVGDAVVQRKELTQTHLSAAFWMNWLVGVAVAIILALAAPWIADFFQQPELVALVRLVSINYVVQLGAVPIALLQRSFRFRAIAFIETSSLALGLVAAIAAAFAGLGPASLILQVVVTTTWFSITSIWLTRWFPRRRPTWRAVHDLWSFSSWVAAGNIVGFWSENVDTVALGRTQPPNQVGYYNRAFNLLGLPLTVLVNVPGFVAIPALASIQEDHERSRRSWLEGVFRVAQLTFPTCVGMAVAAPALILTLWGEQWIPVVPFIQILAVAGIPWAVNNACQWPLLARGRGRAYFLLKALNTIVTVASVGVGLRWGAMGVAWAILLRSLIMLPIWIVGSLRELDITVWDVLWQLRHPFVAALSMGVVVLAVGQLVTSRGIGELIIQVAVGVVIYGGMTALSDREEARALLGSVRSRLSFLS